MATWWQKIGSNVRGDILSGLLVALALVPESVAFAFVAGVEPLVALYASAIVCMVTSLVGGRPGLISAATAPLAVMMTPLVMEHGVEYLFAAVILMGVIQMVLAGLRLGKFVRMVPYSVLLGFLNGLAIIIFLAQMSQFQTLDPVTGAMVWLQGGEMWTMLGLVGLTLGIIYLFPYITKKVPSPLVALIVVGVLVQMTPLESATVSDVASVGGGLPSFAWPDVPMNWEALKIIAPYSVIFALIGFVHSLMSMSVVDEMTETRGHGNRVVLGQGIANFITGFFGGMGGTSMIGQTIINIQSGGRTSLSGIVAGGLLLLFIVVLAPLIEMIPLAALVGIMFMVVIGTFRWSSVQILHKVPRTDGVVMVICAGLIVFTNVAYAVFVGIIVAALAFAWEKSKKIVVKREEKEEHTVHYTVDGPLFFASTTRFQQYFTPMEDPKKVIVEFAGARIYDQSAVEEVNKLIDRYQKQGVELHLRHVNQETRDLLRHAADVFDTDADNDPRYHLVVDGSVLEEMEGAGA